MSNTKRCEYFLRLRAARYSSPWLEARGLLARNIELFPQFRTDEKLVAVAARERIRLSPCKYNQRLFILPGKSVDGSQFMIQL
jgi:hypothetical protein